MAFAATAATAAEFRHEFRFGPGQTLSGEIILPDERTNTPVVIFLPPAGDIDRHGTSEILSTFAGEYDRYAKAVIHAGWGVVRYDAAGTGKSPNAHAGEQAASDARVAVIDAAAHQPSIVPQTFVILAQSTAAWTVASRAAEIRLLLGGRLRGWILLSNLAGPSVAPDLADHLLVVTGSGDGGVDMPSAAGITDAHRAAFPDGITRLVYLNGYDHALCRMPTGQTISTPKELARRWRGKPGTCETPARVYESITDFLKSIGGP